MDPILITATPIGPLGSLVKGKSDVVDGKGVEALNPKAVDLQSPSRIRSYSEALIGNRDASKGWTLEYTKPASLEGVVISNEEWDVGATMWNTTLVGYPIGQVCA